MRARAGLILIVATAILAVVSTSALPSVNMHGGQSSMGAKHGEKGSDDGLSQAAPNSEDNCSGPAVRLPSTKLFIEHNSTDEDTGVHGLFDGIDWRKLLIFVPRGRLILEVEPNAQLRNQSISGIFFESAEPPNEDVPIEEILRRFPEGRYQVEGCTKDGRRLKGSALFTHDIPAGPVITFPQDGGMVSASNLTITWNHVTTTLDGRPLRRTGYEVIVTKDVPDDPNGFSLPVTFTPAVGKPADRSDPLTKYRVELSAGTRLSGNITVLHLKLGSCRRHCCKADDVV
jgi:hypothetical protein